MKPVPGQSTAPKPTPDTKNDLKYLPLSEVEKKLNTSPEGLSQAEAEKRLSTYGPNEIEEKKINLLLKFLSYFWGPIPWMIEVAVILSGVVRHWPDFFIILLLLLANAAVGFFEEREAGNAIEALKAKLAIKARVRRDGKWVTPHQPCPERPRGWRDQRTRQCGKAPRRLSDGCQAHGTGSPHC